ncbi:helix-turn-helix domain-containing protein [Escherichia coli]|nr:helix-turn-helix domain-containing protein [Escherichia coli]MEE4498174.1 helix-turn-helix domain-containing protein [Escherichia coli]MEE4511736.1 helix-turn-helix domain-containing protein [Escherichia coli]MEE4520870.1 helix-turn-helix domain-containing protein [Escherichia coli]
MTKKDWHPADIIAALHKRGTSMAKLSREAGLASSTLANALNRPWPKGEWLIAIALDMHPSEIWPGRYLCIDSLEVRKKPGGHWIIRDLAGLDLVGLASL